MLKPARLTLLLLASALTSPAVAVAQEVDTLSETLAATYRTNPTLTGERAALEGDAAAVSLAKAGGRPTMSAIAGLNRDLTRSGILDSNQPKGPDLTVGADLSLPLFQGGRVRNNVRAARARLEAGEADLRSVEGDIFVAAVAAYMDVRLNRDVVSLNQNQVRVLGTNLEAAKDRFEIGDVTRTDVAQSEARLQLSEANLASAEGRMASAVETFREVVGVLPGDLAPPPPLPPLPESPEEAARLALAHNADYQSIIAVADAAGYDVKAARADRLPSLSAVGSGTYYNGLGGAAAGIDNSGTQTSVGLNSRIPIYQGGAVSARIAQARAFEGQLLERRVAVERAVVADARAAYATWEAANRAIKANEVAVAANELALEGARLENSIGSRTILEVLNAEQELLNSQVSLATARRDAYVAGFRLLDAMGQAEAEDLDLGGAALYEPLGTYRDVSPEGVTDGDL